MDDSIDIESADLDDAATIIDGTAFSSANGTTILDSNAGQIGAGGTVGLGADGVLGNGDDVTISQFERTELGNCRGRDFDASPVGQRR